MDAKDLLVLLILAAVVLALLVGGGLWVLSRSVERAAAPGEPPPAAPPASATEAAPPSTVVAAGTGVRVEMRYVEKGFPMGLSTGQADRFECSSARPSAIRVLPPAETGDLLFGEIPVAGVTYPYAIGGAGLYIDADRNGDLTDDTGPFPAGGNRFFAGHATVPTAAGPYRMWFFTSNMGGATYYAACHRAGSFPFEKAYPMVLFDADPDGDYSDESLVIDFNEDGKAVAGEVIRVGQPFAAGGRAYRLVSIDPSGAFVTIAY